MNLYFFPDGQVRTCCRNSDALGIIGEDRLPDIWRGARRAELVKALERSDFGGGCSGCGIEIKLEGKATAYPSTFERFVEHPIDQRWPQRMEFNLSNSCNLQCLQCNGDLSSSIRLHREGKPPLDKPYGATFFEDLRSFIPHLRWAQFAGGEPFLAAENYQVWEMIAELNAHVACHVVTNATQWNSKVERVVNRVPMGFVFSLDASTKALYESIRVGADFDRVMQNVERFRQVAALHETTTSINFCMMRQNFHGFGDVLLYAEERGMKVDVSVVRDPEECSIAFMDVTELHNTHEFLLRESARVAPQLKLNLAVWHAELSRIKAWTTSTSTALAGAKEQWVRVRTPSQATILGFPVGGNGPHDDNAVAVRLDDHAGRIVYEVTVDEGETVVAVSDGLATVLGIEESALLGLGASSLQEAIIERFGPPGDPEVVRSDDNHVRMRATFGSVQWDVSMVALRDQNGQAYGARIFLGVLAS